MSLISTPSKTLSWRDLWPLAVFLLLLAGGASLLIHYWPRILLSSIIWQRELHQELAGLLRQVKENPMQAGMMLAGFSLIYGVIHAIGPGHGKIVITTYLATHPSRLKNSLKLTFASAIVQGLVAILLVSVVLGVLQLSSRQLHQSSFWMERGSFILVMLLGLLLCWRALKRMWQTINSLRPVHAMKIHSLSPMGNETHVHDEHCGCGHQHVPNDQQLQAGGDLRTQVAIVLAMGLRPCSGAIMVLLFSKVIGVYNWGVISAITMAIGTSLTVSLIGVLVFYSRALAVKLSATRTPAAWQRITWSLLALTGGIVLLVAGILLFSTGGGDVSPITGGPFRG
ncbi:nickel/cobalt transporter [Rahnella aceris]|jgi:ABC-type nickel/cobalt efflux system permease component RcnA|uniref:nickel/cobalt transporter n=1 Tax=Rahnella sp. (strain Y9602) TaxID=2703885 RepID=UPI000E64EF0A|nr:nickel/cobalt transporter [Rahnella aceris]AYA06001.1 nickel/cobalt transporter [Rahnella aquatilis]AZP49990.1 nickel/cobalt transporter [Rahnella aquatilis]NIA86764.1 nickel/cobalt transporter [Rahnella aceris]RKT81749.1 ABC-type nickel/cobalt efflux system permease component RcnA [Rahnella aquatilis]UNK51425.1 nickel/cobalt transporter [Rahnella aceris]